MTDGRPELEAYADLVKALMDIRTELRTMNLKLEKLEELERLQSEVNKDVTAAFSSTKDALMTIHKRLITLEP